MYRPFVENVRTKNKNLMLNETFYIRQDVVLIARELLGKVLITDIDGKVTSGKIVETEAYSYREKACHAYMNRNTKRTSTLFKSGGTSYVYLCYGIHKLFNVVTNVEGVAEAILIRGIEPLDNIELMMERRGFVKPTFQLTSGPGKLTQAMGIDMNHNERSLYTSTFMIEDRGYQVDEAEIEVSARIGVAYAEQDALLPWRFSLKDNRWVSKGFNNYNFS